jgi:hypothetical protein
MNKIQCFKGEAMNSNEALRTVLSFIFLMSVIFAVVRSTDYFIPRTNDTICALAMARKERLEELQIRYLEYKIECYEPAMNCGGSILDDSKWLEESYEDLED